MAEGSMWEAFEAAGHQGLDNLVAIIDVNRLGQTGETMHGWDLDAYRRRAEAFGWHAIEIDGHDVAAIDAAYAEAIETSGLPTVIIARTEKGHGVTAVENLPGKHGKPVDDEAAAIEELGGLRDISVSVPKPDGDGEPHAFPTQPLSLPVYEPGSKEATRKAFADATARWATAPTPRSSPRRSPSASCSRTSPSSRCSRTPSACRCVAGSRTRQPSPPSWRAPTTSCGWLPSVART
jgi:transketolase